MNCPNCQADSEVNETRPYVIETEFIKRRNSVRRRRHCPACLHRWTTVEVPADELQVLERKYNATLLLAGVSAEEVKAVRSLRKVMAAWNKAEVTK